MSGVYDQVETLALYLDAHYGPAHFEVANFPASIIARVMEATSSTNARRRALDLGCGPGRGSFELARWFEHVDGVDSSSLFVETATRLCRLRSVGYSVVVEGDLLRAASVNLDSLGLGARERNVHFHVGDACRLEGGFENYDLIVAANLLDRLDDPEGLLVNVSRRLARDGVLALASPYTWLAEFTPRESWLGGVVRNGRSIRSFDTLAAILGERFTMMVPAEDVQFVIRETERKYQHSVSQLTLWRLNR